MGYWDDQPHATNAGRRVTLSSNSEHRLATATHVGLLDDEHSFEPSVQAIADVVQSIRSGAPVVTR
jgi:hypothetical protein